TRLTLTITPAKRTSSGENETSTRLRALQPLGLHRFALGLLLGFLLHRFFHGALHFFVACVAFGHGQGSVALVLGVLPRVADAVVVGLHQRVDELLRNDAHVLERESGFVELTLP